MQYLGGKIAQNIKPPRGKLRSLYYEKDKFTDYCIMFATDTKRFYMKLGDELVAFTPPMESMNKKHDFVCRNCNLMLPSTAWTKNSSVVRCERCGFVFDSFLDDCYIQSNKKRVESTICKFDLAEYIMKEIDKIIPTTSETYLKPFFDPSTGNGIYRTYIGDIVAYAKIGTCIKNPIVFTYPFIDTSIEDTYHGKDIKVHDSYKTCKLIAILEAPSKRIKKPENKKLKIEGIWFDGSYEETDTPEGLFKDAIEAFRKRIEDLKEEYGIIN